MNELKNPISLDELEKGKARMTQKLKYFSALSFTLLVCACSGSNGHCEPEKQEGCDEVYRSATAEPPKGTLKPVILKDDQSFDGKPDDIGQQSPSTEQAVDDIANELGK